MPILQPPSPPKHYPKGWPSDQLPAAVTRFGARFRVAKAFRKIEFVDGISDATAAGYSSILRLFLSYTAWEQYEAAFRLNSKRREIERTYCTEELRSKLRRLGVACRSFLQFLKSDSEAEALKRNIEALLSEAPFSVLHVGEAVRHSFAHGVLTPSAWRSSAQNVAGFCDVVATFIIDVMDQDAQRRIVGLTTKRE